MRSSSLYFAVRSERAGAPVLIWPAPVATARWAIVVSSVSPERCEITAAKPASCASRIASRVSLSVPIWLSLTRIAFAARSSMPRCSRSMLVTNRSSPTSWTRSPVRSVQPRPARPVVLGHAVLDRDDRVVADPLRPERGELAAVQRAALAREDVAAALAFALVELRDGGIEGDRDLVAGDAAGGGDGVHQQVERLAVRAEPGREAALVADGGAVAAGGEQVAQGVVDLRGPAQALAEAVRAERHHHELLEVGGAGGVRAAVEQVRHRHGQRARLGIAVEAAEVAEQREASRPWRRGPRRARRRGSRSRRARPCWRCRRWRSAPRPRPAGRPRRGRAPHPRADR